MPVHRHPPKFRDRPSNNRKAPPTLKNKLLFFLFLILTLQFPFSQNAFAYLDPGTGSYIFQVLVATLIGALFTIKMYWQKIKLFFSNLFFRKWEK